MIAASEAPTSSVASATCSKPGLSISTTSKLDFAVASKRRRRFRAGRARHPPLQRRTGPEHGDRAAERAGLDAIRQRLLPGQHLLQAAVRRDTGQEPGGQVSIARIGVHGEHTGAAFGDGQEPDWQRPCSCRSSARGETKTSDSRGPRSARIRSTDPAAKRNASATAECGSALIGNPRVGCPVRPQCLFCFEGRNLADQRHTVERRGILPVNEALPAAGPYVGDGGTQHEPDQQPVGGGSVSSRR